MPYRWIEQTTPGGRIVAPLTNTYEPPGVLTLRVSEHGTASGRLSGPAAFMGMRAERIARPEPWDEIGKNGTESTTDIHPWRLVGNRNAAVAIGQRIGDGVHCTWQDTSKPGTGYQWFLHPHSRSWAWMILDGPAPHTVRHGGPHRVFDEIVDAYQWWRDNGEPAVKDWLVTVSPEGQTITLAG